LAGHTFVGFLSGFSHDIVFQKIYSCTFSSIIPVQSQHDRRGYQVWIGLSAMIDVNITLLLCYIISLQSGRRSYSIPGTSPYPVLLDDDDHDDGEPPTRRSCHPADAMRENLFKPPRHDVDALLNRKLNPSCLMMGQYQTIKILANPILYWLTGEKDKERTKNVCHVTYHQRPTNSRNRNLYSIPTKNNRVKTVYFSRKEGDLLANHIIFDSSNSFSVTPCRHNHNNRIETSLHNEIGQESNLGREGCVLFEAKSILSATRSLKCAYCDAIPEIRICYGGGGSKNTGYKVE
jgi:hypothetical protein